VAVGGGVAPGELVLELPLDVISQMSASLAVRMPPAGLRPTLTPVRSP
jgi:hypothetical protein